MGLLSTAVGTAVVAASAASAAKIAVPLGNQIILESNYQRVANPDAKALYAGETQEVPESMRELEAIHDAYKKTYRRDPLDKETFKQLRSRLDTWSRQNGTKRKSASSIMREHPEFANDKLLKERKKDEEKAKKEADKLAKKDHDAKKKAPTSGKARGGTSTSGASSGSHRR